MKKLAFSAIGLALFGTALGQFPYSATVLNEYYLPLENATALDLGVGWDDPEVQIPLEFSLDLDGTASGGILSIGGTGEMLLNTTETGTMNILWPISLDIMDIGAVEAEEFSSIRYEVSGEEPNRILKVEWHECGLYDEVALLESANLRLNFQTWIYESGGIIEYRFGPNTLNDSLPESEFLTSGIILGFDYDYYDGTFYTASGAPENPDWSLTDDFYQWYYSGSNLNSVPVEGTVYRFGPAVNVNDLGHVDASLSVYPNPARDQLWVQNGSTAVEGEVLDITGRIVAQFFLAPGERHSLATSDWASGSYYVRTTSPSGERAIRQFLVR